MYCPQCGNEIKNGAIYCSSCGTEIKGREISSGIHGNSKRSINKKIIIMAVALVMICCVGIGIAFTVLSGPSINGTWRLSGEIVGDSEGVAVDLPEVELNIKDEQFALHVQGRSGGIMLFGLGGIDPVDLTINGRLELEEESPEELVYRINFSSLEPSDDMINELVAMYAPNTTEEGLREYYSDVSRELVQLSTDNTIRLHVPVSGIDSTLGDGEWSFEVGNADGMYAEFGIRFYEEDSLTNTVEAFITDSDQTSSQQNGTWQRETDSKILAEFTTPGTYSSSIKLQISREPN